jgi:hypothetical protein
MHAMHVWMSEWPNNNSKSLNLLQHSRNYECMLLVCTAKPDLH